MIVLTQCVSHASVVMDGDITGAIDRGLLVYVGVGQSDTVADAQWAARKVAQLRVFADSEGKLNGDVTDIGGEVLAISNFTLMGDGRKGNRPSYVDAAKPDHAQPLFEAFVADIADRGIPVGTGVFGAHMQIDSQADGPVNLILQSPGG
jgi:D-tyrosyl-tRNA(Tyr) deacylase